jgi:hypothetical protein
LDSELRLYQTSGGGKVSVGDGYDN